MLWDCRCSCGRDLAQHVEALGLIPRTRQNKIIKYYIIKLS
jgi:hypothetical protein